MIFMTSGEGTCITYRLGHGSGRHFDLDGPRAFAKSVGMIFLSQRNLNISSSLNNPVLGSKIVGKTQKKRSEKKATKFESWLTSDNFLPCISYRTYHFHVCLFSARTETYLSMSVFQVLWISTVFLSFDPVSSCWTHRDKIYATYQTTCWSGSHSISNVKTFPVNCFF